MKDFEDQHSYRKKNVKRSSKEKIINQAIKLHQQGNITEAQKYYIYCINQGFDDPRVFSNYGIILCDLGKLEEAEFYIRKAIKIKPNFADAHTNLAIIMKDLGNLREAELLQRKAIELKPDFADSHFNLGSILRNLGNLKEAELSTRKAITLNPDFAMAYSNLGIILKDIGKAEEAFLYYLKAIKIDSDLPNIYNLITDFLQESDPSKLNKTKLKNILNLLLKRNNISHKKLFKTFNFLYRNELINNLKSAESDILKGKSFELLINDKLIINALKKITFKDIKLEKILTETRQSLCARISENREAVDTSELEFIIALGEQCFLNEYVYSITKEETISVNKIIQRCRDNNINEENIAILSCYMPLYKLLDKIPSLQSINSTKNSFKELIKLQISEPKKEIQLSKNIKKLGLINDNTSQKVKSQYEQNPYPRWKYGNPSKERNLSIAQAINNEIAPNSISLHSSSKQIKILIAGCGTGNQILQAQRYNNAHITAIDLSLSSLSFAQRKINEFNINNVELIQMDILEVCLLKEHFDIIECSGVLHHMKNPSQGLKALLNVLKPNSFLKLGLYSQLARQDIIQARQYIARKMLQANEVDIHHFRETVFSGQSPELKPLIKRSDFYTLSSCRDLCFHSQEHRFTMEQLSKTITSNKLKFLGFLLPQTVKSLYKKYFPEDKTQINLQRWSTFEEKHPNTFNAMYQFWVSR